LSKGIVKQASNLTPFQTPFDPRCGNRVAPTALRQPEALSQSKLMGLSAFAA